MHPHHPPRHAAPARHRMRRRATALLLSTVAATTAGILAPAPAMAVPNGSETVRVGDRRVEVTFNDPGNDAQWDHAARLIRDAPRGSTIRMAIYNIVDNQVMRAIRGAKDRGVEIRVVANGEWHGTPRGATLEQLSTLLGSDFRWCDADSTPSGGNDACISDDPSGLMHAKYMTFSQTRGPNGTLQDDVVWVSSANFSDSGKDLYNNAVTVYNDRDLYRGFVTDLWQPMWRDVSFTRNDYYDADSGRGYFSSAASNSTVYVSPEQDTDLWVNRLAFIDADDDCRIRVMQNRFNDTRIEVAEKLRELADDGCRIRVVTEFMEDEVRAALDHENIRIRRADVHDKTFLVDAKYDGSTANRVIVFTGSHNLSESALSKNDELILKLADSPALHQLFLEHFRRAWKDGTVVDGGGSSS